jgi:hypothetical protein
MDAYRPCDEIRTNEHLRDLLIRTHPHIQLAER